MLTREDILQEIRKTAKENVDTPLGQRRFEDITGITGIDWRRYWARFGDAQREAGFEANKLKTAFPDEHIFEKFISFTRELDKIPVKGELIMKRYNDPEFPSPKTFLRLGNKRQFLTKLLEYSRKKKYSDIIELCSNVLEKGEEILEEDTVAKVENFGSVYLAKSGKYYKIGRTNSLGRRHHEITILLPESFILIHEIKTDDPSGIEGYWHKRFELKRKMGEWFNLNSSDIKAFKRWRKII